MYSQTYGKQKASGNAKLKFYCQMCRKQCLDDNGFKCHTNSDYHMSQMRKYHEDPESFIEKFSQEFEDAFVMVLQDKFKNQKVSANQVYMELIKIIDHVHLNGTRWTTLNQFCKHLQTKNNIELVPINDHDSYITYIDKSAIAVKNRKQQEKKQKLGNQVDKISKIQTEAVEEQIEVPESLPDGVEISFNINITKTNNTKVELSELPVAKKLWVEKELEKQPNLSKLYDTLKMTNEKPELPSKQVIIDKEPWLMPGIIVKVLDQDLLGGKLFGKKGVVKLVEEYSGLIEMQTSKKEKIMIDQKLLETVIPKIGFDIMVLKEGPHRGKVGKLISVHQDNFSATIQINDDYIEVEFDGFSKLEEQ